MTSLSLNRLSCFLLNNNDVVVVWDRNYYVVVILAAKSKVLDIPIHNQLIHGLQSE